MPRRTLGGVRLQNALTDTQLGRQSVLGVLAQGTTCTTALGSPEQEDRAGAGVGTAGRLPGAQMPAWGAD